MCEKMHEEAVFQSEKLSKKAVNKILIASR